MPSQEWLINFRTKKEGNAPKELAGELKEVKSGLVGAIEGFTGLSIGSLGLAGAIAGVGVKLKESVDLAVSYAEQVRDLGRISGASAEESSKLIQVSDDLKVEYSTLTAAAKKLATEGIALTTDELAKASDQYLAYGTAAERTEFAVKKFGKAGLEMTKILEVGGDAIRKMADEQSGNLILTEAQVQKAREYEIAQDGLNDTLDGFKVVVGNAVIPMLTSMINGFTNAISAADQMKAAFAKTARDAANNSSNIDQFKDSIKNAGYEFDTAGNIIVQDGEYMGRALYRVVVPAQDVAKAYTDIKDKAAFLSEENRLLESSSRLVGVSTYEAGQKARDTEAYYSSLAATMAGEAVTAAAAEKGALDLLNASMGELTNNVLYNTASEGLNAQGKMALALQMGLINEKTFSAVSAEQALRTAYENGQMSLEEYARASGDLARALGLIQSRDVTVTVHYRQDGQMPSDPKIRGSYAKGGSFVIPPGYPNDTYPLGPNAMGTSGEVVTVTPKGRGGGGAGALPAMTVNIYNGMDLEAFKRMLIKATR